MTRLAFALAAAAVVAAAGCSHNNPSDDYPYPQQVGARGGGAMRVDDALRGISLSPDQMRRVQDIESRYQDRIRDERGEGDRDDVRKLRRQEVDEIREVLDRDQRRQFDANLQYDRGRGDRYGNRDGRYPPQR